MASAGERLYNLVVQNAKNNSTRHEEMMSFMNGDNENLLHIDNSGNTTIHAAVIFQLPEVSFDKLIDALVKHNPKVLELKNTNGYTAMHEAAQRDRSDHARILAAKGADAHVTTRPQTPEGETPVHLAARFNSVECLKVLLNTRPRTGDVNHLKETALHIAAAAGNVDCVSVLLQYGAQTAVRDKNDFTPLHGAAATGSLEVVKILCDNGALHGAITQKNWTALHLAAHNNQPDVIQELLTRFNNVNNITSEGQSALHLAAKITHGSVKSVEILLSYEATIDLKDAKKSTPLHLAVMRGNKECVQALLKHDANRDRPNGEGQSPLHLALIRDSCLPPKREVEIKNACLQKLLLKGAKITSDDEGRTPLHFAARYDNPQVIMDLVNRGNDINAQDNYGMTPLHTAAAYGQHVFVQALLGKGLDSKQVHGKLIKVDAKDSKGRTALYIAVALEETECAEALLDKNASPVIKNEDGISPLHKAAMIGKESILQEMLKKPVDLEIEDIEGWTPLHVATMKGYQKCVQILLEAGAKVDAALPVSLYTPLHMAAEEGRRGCLEVLLKYGANVDAVTSEGETAKTLAQQNNHVYCLDDLEARQSQTNGQDQGGNQVTTDAVRFESPNYERNLESRQEELEVSEPTSLSNGDAEENEACAERLRLDANRLNESDGAGNTCLHKEAELNHVGHLSELIEKGAEPHRQNGKNMTPLHVATQVGGAECVKYLLEHPKLNSEPKDDTNSTPLHLAAGSGHINVVDIFCAKKPTKYLQAKNILGENAFHVACKEGKTPCAEAMMSRLDADEKQRLLDVKTSSGATALHLAAEGNHDKCVDLLKKSGAEVLVDNDKKQNVFEVLVTRDHVESLSKVLRTMEEVKELDKNLTEDDKEVKSTLMFVAVKHGAVKCLGLLIETGADVYYKNEQNMTAAQVAMDAQQVGCTKLLLEKMAEGRRVEMLHYAAKNGYTDVVKMLADEGVALDAVDGDGLTALLMAAAQGHEGCVEVLVEGKADVNHKDVNGFCALLHAARNGHASCVEVLLQARVVVDSPDLKNATALHYAAREDRLDCLKFLLEAGALTDNQTNELWTAMHYAAQNGHLECVKLLVEKGANYNCITLRGFTPIRFATDYEQWDVVSFLAELPDIALDTRDRNNNAAIHVATKYNDVSTVRALLTAGADVDLIDGQNRTALNIAAASNNKPIVTLLLQHDAKVDHVDKYQNTPLLSAAKKCHVETCEVLLEAGANVNYANDKTALHYAVAKKNPKCVELLLKHGADRNRRDEKGQTPWVLAKNQGCNKKKKEDILRLMDAKTNNVEVDNHRPLKRKLVHIIDPSP